MSIKFMYRGIITAGAKLLGLSAALALLSVAHAATQPIMLKEAIRLALESSPDVAIAVAKKSAAQASAQATHAYLNPELEYHSGETTSRLTGVSGRNEIIGLSLPIELYGIRSARQAKVAPSAVSASKKPVSNPPQAPTKRTSVGGCW